MKTCACGPCDTFLLVHNTPEVGIERGTVMGHELCGEVVEVGQSVRKWKVGDRVCSVCAPSIPLCIPSQSAGGLCEEGYPFKSFSFVLALAVNRIRVLGLGLSVTMLRQD